MGINFSLQSNDGNLFDEGNTKYMTESGNFLEKHPHRTVHTWYSTIVSQMGKYGNFIGVVCNIDRYLSKN